MSLDRWQQLFFGIVLPSSCNGKPTGKAVTFHNKYIINNELEDDSVREREDVK